MKRTRQQPLETPRGLGLRQPSAAFPLVAHAQKRQTVAAVKGAVARNEALCGEGFAMHAWKLLLCGGVALIIAAGCTKHDEAPKAEEKKAETPWKVSRNMNGEAVLLLDAATQARVGLQLTTLAGAQVSPEIKAVGRVLDPTAFVSLLGEVLSLRAAAEASAKELERAKLLAKSDNTTARALEAAEASAARDTAQLEVARGKLTVALGPTLAARTDLPAFVASLVSGESALVRLDLAAGEILKTAPMGARLLALAADTAPVETDFLSAAPSVDAQAQSQGFFFLLTNPPPQFKPGAAVTGFIKLAGEAQAGVVIPRDAVVRKDGLAWAYVQTDVGEFTRREVATDRSADAGWFVTRNFSAGDKVVTSAEQILLSEEMSAAGFSEGEHH